MKWLMLALGSAALIANAPAFAQNGQPAAAHPQVLFKTSEGDIRVELYPEKAPKTVDNFLQYVKAGQYNGTIFHRVIRHPGHGRREEDRSGAHHLARPDERCAAKGNRDPVGHGRRQVSGREKRPQYGDSSTKVVID